MHMSLLSSNAFLNVGFAILFETVDIVLINNEEVHAHGLR